MPFREIVGHQPAIRLASRAIARGSLPPSLLLSGPDGVGKRLVARAIAQAMNCTAPRKDDDDGNFSLDSCGRCSVCNRISRGTFVDIITLEPSDTGSVTIGQVRTVLGQVGYLPFEGRRRVIVIDDAELMVVPAQHALLKTLEEPPSSAQFLLVTSRPDMLLDTVRSRCAKLRFGFLGVNEIVAVLEKRHNVARIEASAAAASAGGSVGRALSSASGELSASREAALRLLETTATARDTRVLLGAAKLFAARKESRRAAPIDRQELRRRLHAMTSLLRDIEVILSDAPAALANTDTVTVDALHRLVVSFADGRSRRAALTIDRAIEAIDRNASPKVVADWVACQL